MSAISTYLEHIRSKIYAKDVRTAIVNAISQCYDDVNKPALQTEAIEAAVQAKIDAGEMAALTIGDGTITGAKLADGTIPTAKIADGAITMAKLSNDIDLDVETDTTLTQQGIPADAKAVGDAIKNNKGLSDTAAALLISILGNALYTSDQSDAIQALEEALIEGDIVRVTGITLSSSSKTVEYGSTAQITATVTPANATNRTVIWTSSDENVATVSNGTITAVAVGSATITAKTVDGGFTATCVVSVTVENLIKSDKVTAGAYIDRDTGSAKSSNNWTATDYIWLKPNTTYHSEGCFLENFYSFYDTNKTHVSSPPSNVTIEFGPDRNWGAKRKGTIAMGSQGYYFRGSYNTAIQYTPYIALTPIE